jgi:hypothetical protein
MQLRMKPRKYSLLTTVIDAWLTSRSRCVRFARWCELVRSIAAPFRADAASSPNVSMRPCLFSGGPWSVQA